MRSSLTTMMLVIVGYVAGGATGWFAYGYVRDNPLREAINAYESKHYEMALELAQRRIANAGPSDSRAYLYAARSAYQLGRYGEAEVYFGRAASTDLDDIRMRAQGLVTLDRWDEAGLLFEFVLDKEPNDGISIKNLVGVRVRQNRNDEAAELARRLTAIPGHEVLGLATSGMIEYHAGRLDKATTQFKEALRLSPKLEQVDPGLRVMNFEWLAEALLLQDQYDDAEIYAKQALQMSNRCEPARLLGRIENLRGNDEKAIEWYRRALDRNPSDVDTLRALANILLTRGELDEAIKLFEKALQIDPTNAGVRNGLITALIRAGRKEEAAQYSEDVAAPAPTDGK